MGEDRGVVAAKINNKAADNLIAMWRLSNNQTLSKEEALKYVQFKYTREKRDDESQEAQRRKIAAQQG